MGANTSSQLGSSFGSDSKSSTSFDSVINAGSISNNVNHHHHHHSNHGLFISNPTESSINSIGLIFSKDRKLKKLKQKIKTKLKKSSNHSQVFGEMANQLSTAELAQIYQEYRALFFMKELSLHAESARPIASTIRNDLSELYDLKLNSDMTLVYKGVDFPVHKAIVCVRCPYFRELLSKKQQGSVVPVNLDIQGLRVELFNDLLKYLYSGELAGSYDPRSNSASYEALIRISQQCGVPNPLSHDLKHLLETGIFSDASLCFQNSNPQNNNDYQDSNNPNNQKIPCNCCEQYEYSCHQAILSARSPFFRNVILRQQKRSSTLKTNIFSQRMKIILDESIIPRRTARVLLHVMYRDSENLLELIQSSICKCRSNQKDSSGTALVKEVMDLYEIARFLEIDFLVQCCEDMIINLMNIETFMLILKWSEQPHGSPWVKRQALTFLREEFSNIITSTTLLYQLDYAHLREALRSDFLEASELCILKALIKWAENHWLKTLEDREPNLLSSHSLTRKSLRKKEIDDSKLSESISELIGLIRLGHILPIDSEFLSTTIKRGLIQPHPGMMFESNQQPDSATGTRAYTAWLRHITPENENPNFKKPRFFTPYFEECKSILEERLERNISLDENIEYCLMKSPAQVLNKAHGQSAIMPDNLYMIEKLTLAESVVSDGDELMMMMINHNNTSATNPNNNGLPNFHFCLTSTSSSSSAICYEEIDKLRPNLPVLEERMLYMMRQREQELRTSPFCIRALNVSHSRCEALKLIQLRVVREFGLPDMACEVLHLKNSSATLPLRRQNHPPLSNNMDDDEDEIPSGINESGICVNDEDNDSNKMPPPPPRPMMAPTILSASSFNHTHNNSNCDPFSYDSELKLEEISAQYELETQFSSAESHRTLSDYIPDIAFASKEI